MQVVWVLSLVRELRPHMPQSMTKKPEPNNNNNNNKKKKPPKKKPKGKTYIGKFT